MHRVRSFLVVLVLWGMSSEAGVAQDTEPIQFLEAVQQAREPIAIADEPAVDQTFRELTWDNGFRAKSVDGDFRFHIGGRFDFDTAWYDYDRNMRFGTSDSSILQDGTSFRRLRLRTDGRLWKWIDFVAEVNFANIQEFSTTSNVEQVGSVGLTNVYLNFTQLPYVHNIRVGHFQEPFSLERMTSANTWMFMERSPGHDAFLNPFDFSNGGMAYRTFLDDRITGAVAFTRGGRSTITPFGFGVGNDYSATTRWTGLLIDEDEGRRLLHLGAGYSHRGFAGKSLALGNRALVRGGAGASQVPNIMQTLNFFVDDGGDIVNLEMAAVMGRFAISGEYTRVFGLEASTSNGGQSLGSLVFQSAYVEAGYFLTPGDYRRYDRQIGAWGRNVPAENARYTRDDEGVLRTGTGAVQLVTRYSYLDLISGSPVITQPSGAQPGREHNVTIGLDWWLNSQTRIMTNYVWTRIDSVDPTISGTLHGLGLRFHIDF